VNVWVADNFCGKSSILRIIKWCLTGNNDLKPDIKKWIKIVMLEFMIRDTVYSIKIDNTSARPNGALYQKDIAQLLCLEEEANVVFTFKSGKEMEERLQSFFMLNMGLYPLKWTQKSSSKDSIELYESSTSWSTYFKALFMKSDEYNAFLLPKEQAYGNQTQKILGMFLGLGLLKIQNRLGFRIDMIKYELAKQDFSKNKDNETANTTIQMLHNEKENVAKEREKLENELNILVNQSKMNELVSQLGRINNALAAANQRLSAKEAQLFHLNRLIEEEESATIGLKEALHFKLFFNGIQVNTCPHCETKISEEKLRREKEEHICSVCHEPLTKGTEEQLKLLKIKLEENQAILSNLRKEKKELESELDDLRLGILELEKNKKELTEELNYFSRIDVNELNERIRELLLQQGKIEGKIEELLEKIDDQKDTYVVEMQLEKEILSLILSKVEEEAKNVNKSIIDQLKNSVKEWVVRFGIKNVQDVKIDSRLEPQIMQNGEWNNFYDLVDGEKLRFKIAFFVQLMLLASQSGVGKHPQLLLIDSPGTNELIEEHFQAIVDVFREIDEKYSDHCQILIASARQSLKNATRPSKAVVKLNGEPLF